MGTDIRPLDIVRLTPKPIEVMVSVATYSSVLGADGCTYPLDKWDVELVRRQEPRKPAAKVGDKLTGAVVEPPLGAVARRVTSGWEGTAAIGNLRVRTEDGWLLVKGGTPTTDKLLEYNRLDSNGYVLASLPE